MPLTSLSVKAGPCVRLGWSLAGWRLRDVVVLAGVAAFGAPALALRLLLHWLPGPVPLPLEQ